MPLGHPVHAVVMLEVLYVPIGHLRQAVVPLRKQPLLPCALHAVEHTPSSHGTQTACEVVVQTAVMDCPNGQVFQHAIACASADT